MPRPYTRFSFDQLEAEFARASARKDLRALRDIGIEVTQYRKTPEAKALAEKVRCYGTNSAPEKIVPATNPRYISSSQKTSFKPTSEQAAAVDLFSMGGSLKINAYAGAGKTSTLSAGT